MSSLRSINHRLTLPNIEIFTYGQSIIYGYDSFNHCLITIEINQVNDPTINRLFFSITSPNDIKEMKLNPNETIVALLSNERIYFVYLPQSSLNNVSRQCPVEILSLLKYNQLIDFLWLSSNDFILVNTIPSASECHFYRIESSSRDNRIQLLKTYSVGSLKSRRKSSNRYSLDHLSNIIKLDFIKRNEQSSTRILLFALKSDGDIYVLNMDHEQSNFIGPIRILPQSLDNYGADHSHSKFSCFSSCDIPVVLFSNGKNRLNECILLNPIADEYYLFVIHSICLSNDQQIQSIVIDRLNENLFYLLDSLANLYSININWIEQIQRKSQRINPTMIKHLHKFNSPIHQFGFIQTKYQGQWLTFLNKTINHQEKDLIFLRPNGLMDCPIEQVKPSINAIQFDSSSEFVKRIENLLHRDESIEEILQSSSNQQMSSKDFQEDLFEFISEEYLEKQEKVRLELENKQRYLTDYQQTQIIAQQELEQKFQQIYQTIVNLSQRYEQECLRQKKLLENLADDLSIVEQQNPVMSNAEMFMKQQLTRYDVQVNNLMEKFSRLRLFLDTEENNSKSNDRPIDRSSLEHFQQFIQYFRTEIQMMKQRVQRLSQSNGEEN